jgi:membrane-bound ClpP family serine protease
VIRVAAPITDSTIRRVRRQIESFLRRAKQNNAWPVLVLDLEGEPPSEFGQALDLARYLSGQQLSGATTVAYVRGKLSGHAVLVAIACEEIIMHEDAELGDGAGGNAVEPLMRAGYREIAERRGSVPAALALLLLDGTMPVVRVETEAGVRYQLQSELEQLRAERAVGKEELLKPSGERGRLTAQQARQWGVAALLAPDHLAAVKAEGVPPDAVEADPGLEGEWRTARIDVRGAISSGLAGRVQRLISEQREQGVTFICIWLDSPGGSPADSLNVANALAGLNAQECWTVAYIPREARGDAAIIALACDDIVMGGTAVLGGPGAYALQDADELRVTVQAVRDVAEQKMRSPSLAAALIDGSVAVYRYTRQTDGAVEYYSEQDVRELPDAADWQREGRPLGEPGKPLRLSGNKAAELGLAREVVENFAELKALYGLENDPTLVERGWADVLVDALNSPSVAWFLLVVGAVALYIELQTPGVGVGGLVSAICFVLFFWSAFLGGTAGWLEVLLFVLGVVCLLLEVFVFPGFGVFGVGGALLVLLSLILASQTFILPQNEYQMERLRNTLLMIAGAGAAAVLVVALVRRYLPHAPLLNRMLLAPPSQEELQSLSQREALAQFGHLLGAVGTAVTPLVPGGKARFGDELVDVVANGDFIDRGQEVAVVEVRGSRVVVQSRSAAT